MIIFLSLLILIILLIIKILVKSEIYPTNIEIHILGILKIKLQNKEKRPGGPAKAPKRTSKKID